MQRCICDLQLKNIFFILCVLFYNKQFFSKKASHSLELLLLAVHDDMVSKHKNHLKMSIQKVSKALCGIIQVFFMVSQAQYFQNTVILAIKLLNQTCLVSNARAWPGMRQGAL